MGSLQENGLPGTGPGVGCMLVFGRVLGCCELGRAPSASLTWYILLSRARHRGLAPLRRAFGGARR